MVPRSPIPDREYNSFQCGCCCSDPVLDRECNFFQCGCCCSDVLIKDMVQCADGHLFCFVCLQRRVEESTFGGLPAYGPLGCMDMDGCDKSIPWSEIQRVVTGDLLRKFEQRQANESLARAKLQGLIYCPACDFACEVDPDVLVFKCPNSQCQKETCMKCKEPSHEPLQCEDVEKPSETRERNEMEELMSKTLIRECPACNAKLIKDIGCNKITCRCGQGMCYICREPLQDYGHFCEHFRISDKPCKKCGKCNLWQTEDNHKILQNVKKAAIKSKAKEAPSIWTRQIGPIHSFLKKSIRR
eukprot:c5518_g1_i1 orf=175-1074(-)